MKWPGPVIHGKYQKRYKRFLADFLLEDGTPVTAHCANTGSMKTCRESGAPGLLTFHDDPKRKLKYSWQAVQMPDGWVGINTALANHLVVEAIQSGVVAELQNYSECKTEQKYGKASRIDILLSREDRPSCYVEVKNTTLLLADGIVGFPDAVTQRGTKHLRELQEMAGQGHRAVLFFCVQRESATRVRPADDFDPEYAQTLREAAENGVEILAYRARISEEGVSLNQALPVDLD
ncbi:MAG: DNA/RNA nuclease SfsA [Acidobacteriota bacterium]|nr:DNA/RNA nuclease SfsA [Acidobacteriota bacterium]